MNKTITVLALLCGFLLGVVAGPWLWPRDLLQAPREEAAAPQTAAVQPEPPPPPLPPPSEPPPPEPDLVLKGVFLGGEASRALIASGDDIPRPYKTDDKLPDGSVLKTINLKDVEVEKNGETRSLPLERGTPTTEVEPAETGAGDTDDPTLPDQVTEERVTEEDPEQTSDETGADATEEVALEP